MLCVAVSLFVAVRARHCVLVAICVTHCVALWLTLVHTCTRTHTNNQVVLMTDTSGFSQGPTLGSSDPEYLHPTAADVEVRVGGCVRQRE